MYADSEMSRCGRADGADAKSQGLTSCCVLRLARRQLSSSQPDRNGTRRCFSLHFTTKCPDVAHVACPWHPCLAAGQRQCGRLPPGQASHPGPLALPRIARTPHALHASLSVGNVLDKASTGSACSAAPAPGPWTARQHPLLLAPGAAAVATAAAVALFLPRAYRFVQSPGCPGSAPSAIFLPHIASH